MKVLFISLGCDKNLVDSEFMLGKLTHHKFTVTDDEQEADIIVINTCCFIHDAKEESIQSILDMAQYRTGGNCKALIVCGCLAERYRDEILKEIPEVDAVLGTNSTEQICDAIEKVLLGDKYEAYEPLTGIETHEAKRSVSTGGHYAHLKIAEGCSKHCTYCIIPSIRGDFRSVPMEEILSQAQDLAEAGVKELILVAQETTLYGIDLYGKKSLHILLNELNKIPGIYWIRLMYCYPEEIYDELIEAIRDNEKVCHYIDMPIQHGNDAVLKRMGRKSSQALIREKVARLRAAMPDIAIRTTLIVGFPGETEEEFADLQSFVQEMKFDRLGVFSYSQEEGTVAAEMENQIPEETKEERRDIIMDIQKSIAAALCEKEVGKVMEVLIEGKLPEENIFCGRTRRDAPEIDGLVFVSSEEELYSGDFVTVRIREAGDYDLMGDVVYGYEFGE